MMLIVNITNIVYRVKNEATEKLPTSYKNVCLEVNDGTDSFEVRNKTGLFIMNDTGYTPKNFKIWSSKSGIQLCVRLD